jgi:hypothetical protein
MKRYFPYLIALFLVQSCCAYHTVTLKNNSGDDRLVTLRGHRYYLPKDYFWLTDLSSRRHKSKTGQKLQSVTIDSVACTYSFILPRNKKLIVQDGMGFPDYDQQVIVDNSDTIRLRNDPRTKLKYRRIDFFFAVTVDIREPHLDAGPAATAVHSSN